MQFDLIKSLGDGDNQIDYGFVFGGGRQKILLIKAGQDGSIYGYRNKYLKLACEMRELYGFSVVCASTPSSDINQMAQFAEVVKNRNLKSVAIPKSTLWEFQWEPPLGA